MPLYPYKCTACHHEFEEIQKFSDPLIEVCPECGGKTEKQMAMTSFRTTGEGWAGDGYSKKKKTPLDKMQAKIVKDSGFND